MHGERAELGDRGTVQGEGGAGAWGKSSGEGGQSEWGLGDTCTGVVFMLGAVMDRTELTAGGWNQE